MKTSDFAAKLAPDAVLAVEFRRGNELLHAIRPYEVAEMGIPEFGGADSLLLLFHPTPGLHRDSHHPLQIFIGDLFVARRE